MLRRSATHFRARVGSQSWTAAVCTQYQVVYVHESVRIDTAQRNRIARGQRTLENPGTALIDRVACHVVATP